jgi:hypothetical protein
VKDGGVFAPWKGEPVRRRRFPWLTAEDLALLAKLERRDPEAARAFERLLDRQRRADARVRAHETTAADPIEVADRRHARGRFGAGGGRKRTIPTNDDDQ